MALPLVERAIECLGIGGGGPLLESVAEAQASITLSGATDAANKALAKARLAAALLNRAVSQPHTVFGLSENARVILARLAQSNADARLVEMIVQSRSGACVVTEAVHEVAKVRMRGSCIVFSALVLATVTNAILQQTTGRGLVDHAFDIFGYLSTRQAVQA